MLEKTFTALGVVGVILLVLALCAVGPWLSILAINQLFGTAIQLTFWNWLSMTWLHFLVAKGTSKS
jgi:hypothetical protein